MICSPLAPAHGARLLMLARMRVAYSPEQARDEDGKWTDGGGVNATNDLPSIVDVPYRSSARLTESEDFSVGYYTEGNYEDINRSLRAGKKPAGPDGGDWEGLVDIDTAIKKGRLTDDVTLYRGVDGKFHDLLEEGSTFSDPAFVSLTADRKVAGEFAFEGAVLQVRVPRGTHVLSTEGMNELGESEFILGRGVTFRVVRKTTFATVIEVVKR